MMPIVAKDLITHLLCVDPGERYTIDEFLAHPWCNARPAPAPPATPAADAMRLRAQYNLPLDSPLLAASRGARGGVDGAGMRSPGLATLKEAFDVTYAVHRMEEEGARRRAYNGPGGAGTRGFLQGLNEVDEGEEEDAERAVVDDARRKQDQRKVGFAGSGRAGQRDLGIPQAGHGHRSAAVDRSIAGATSAGSSVSKRRSNAASRGPAGGSGFELDLGNATLIGRRKKDIEPSPLGKGSPVAPSFSQGPGSPMRGVEHA